jgi:hypothetical protein
MSAITDGLDTVLTWIGSVITSLLSGELSALLPLFAIGIIVSVIMLGVKVLRSFTWGS